ncbi:MAG: hypothetical protein M3209_08980 [Acidobacteriota bacterium]|nr:hypothetical protein [Acidobacteriota bacterium]
MIAARKGSDEQISVFQDFVYDDPRALREVINKGERSFRDLYKLLTEANKFKNWLKDQNPDQKLIKAYFKEVTKKSWIDKLPSKTARWSLFQLMGFGIDALGAGGLGSLFKIGLSASDKFLLDKILKGWKPNQFIETSKKEFLNTKNNQK